MLKTEKSEGGDNGLPTGDWKIEGWTTDRCTLDTMATHILFESASGLAVFDVVQAEEIGAKTREVQESIQDISKFSRMVSLKSFSPFKSAADALQNINDISEGSLRVQALFKGVNRSRSQVF